MNRLLTGMLAGLAVLGAGCAGLSLYVPVVKSAPLYQEGQEAYAVVVMGVNLPAVWKGAQMILYAGGGIIGGKGVSEPGFKPDRMGGAIFECDTFTEADANSHAYLVWQVPKQALAKGTRAVAYPNNLFQDNNKFTARKLMAWDNGAAAPVNVANPGDMWYTNAPVFTIDAPGIYYLGEMSLEGVNAGPNDSCIISSAADHEKFKAFLASQNQADADYIDQSGSWTKIRGSDFLDYLYGRK